MKKTPLADPANRAGYVEIDKNTMQHTRYPDVFALGDAGSSPNSKTGAAIRKQTPVVVVNLVDVMAGKAPSARHDGYASCPLTTSRHSILLAEFDYSTKPTPSIPVINAAKERRDMGYLSATGSPRCTGRACSAASPDRVGDPGRSERHRRRMCGPHSLGDPVPETTAGRCGCGGMSVVVRGGSLRATGAARAGGGVSGCGV